MHSAIYTGLLRHRRFQPRAHQFRYRIFMMYLDLDEIDAVMATSRWWSRERFNLASFRRADYLGGGPGSLKNAVLGRVEQDTGRRPNGAVRMLTHLRYFGYVFNPVTFYYCEHDGRLDTVVAEITNTPWGERHAYVLPVERAASRGATWQWQFDKRFHVSPFMAMDKAYDWRFSAPGERLLVHMEVNGTAATEFDATLTLQREPLRAGALTRVLWRFPLMCTRVILSIHIQALKLWLKRVPVIDHPGRTEHS